MPASEIDRAEWSDTQTLNSAPRSEVQGRFTPEHANPSFTNYVFRQIDTLGIMLSNFIRSKERNLLFTAV